MSQTRAELQKIRDAEMWERMKEPTKPCPCGGKKWTRWSSSIWADSQETKYYIWYCPDCYSEEKA